VTSTRKTKQEAEQGAATYLSQSALALVRLCRKHFGITGKGERLKIEAPVRSENVARFLTEYRARVRPSTLSESQVLPEPSESVLRTFLWTRPVADAVLNDVVRLALYSDEVVLVDPFSMHTMNVAGSKPPMGPAERPDLWTQEFANHALTVCALEDWFESGLVLLIPEPRNFIRGVPSFTALALRAVKEGKLSTRPDADTLQDVLEATAFNADRDEDLTAMTRDSLPQGLSDDERSQIISSLIAYRRANPTRYAQRPPETGSVFSFASGQNIFEAAWIADSIGGYVVPRLARDRTNFRSFSRGNTRDDVDALASAFAAAPLPMLNNVSLSDALDLRKSGRLARFRTFLQDVWTATSDPDSNRKNVERERDLVARLNSSYEEAKVEWGGIYKDLGVKGSVAIFGTKEVAQVIQAGVIPVAAGALGWLYHQWAGPTRSFRRRSAGLLVQLENQSSPNPIRRAVDAIERKIS
jgi:hypothetical protein